MCTSFVMPWRILQKHYLCLIYFCVPPNSKHSPLCIVTINKHWVDIFIQSIFILLNAYYMLDIVLGTGDTVINETDKTLVLLELLNAKILLDETSALRKIKGERGNWMC